MATGRNKVTIKIPRGLYNRLRTIVDGTDFGSVTEFIVYVMRDLAGGSGTGEQTGLTRREVEMVRNRLRSLGYLE